MPDTWIQPLKVYVGSFLLGRLLRGGLGNKRVKVNNFSKGYFQVKKQVIGRPSPEQFGINGIMQKSV